MIYTWDEIVKIEGNRFLAESNITKGKYKKVSHGIYTDSGVHISELEQLFVQYPRATLTLQSAFEYYSLSDYIPDKYYIVTPYNAHRITNSKVVQSYMNEEVMKIGREKIQTEHGYIYIFDKERMLIELVRLSHRLPYDYYHEVIASYRILKSMNVISMYKISEYCKHIPYGMRVLKTIQEVI